MFRLQQELFCIMTWYKKIGLYIGSGLLLGIGFVVPFTWPLGIVGIAVLLYAFSITKSWWKGLCAAYLAMLIKFFFVLSDYWSLYPLDWLPFKADLGQLAIVGMYWVSVSAYFAFSGPVLFLLWRLVLRFRLPDTVVFYVAVPLIWIISELSGSFTMFVFTLGPGSTLNASFSLGYVGYLIAQHHLLALIARFGGVYILGFITVALGSGLYQYWSQKPAHRGLFVFATGLLLLLTSTASIPNVDAHTKSHLIALISTETTVENLFERTNLLERAEKQTAAMEAALTLQPDYVLWPEDARYFSQFAGNLGISMYAFTHADARAVVIDSSVVKTDAGRVLRASVYDGDSKEEFVADKRYLVPQGEYMPYMYVALFNLVGLGDIAAKVSNAVSYVVGPNTSQESFSESIPAILFCFESTDPNGVRKLVAERGDVPFVVHPVSHTWFHSPKSFWLQMDTALRVQAIWNNTYIASAANNAKSKLYTPLGEIYKPTEVASGDGWEVGYVNVPKKK